MSEDGNSSVPRGLVSRQGISPSNQRLPSFRSSLTSALSGGDAGHTRGGVLKKTFKPNIPARKTESKEEIAIQNSIPSTSKETPKSLTIKQSEFKLPNAPQQQNQFRRNQTPTGRGNHGRDFQDRKPKTEYIQLESAVFNSNIPERKTPAPRTPRSEFSAGSVSRRTKSEYERKEIRAEVKRDTKMRDAFISELTEGEQKLPRGYENAVGVKKEKGKKIETNNHAAIFKTEEKDKLLLFQVPDLLLKKQPGLIGKLKLYKSGRMEIVDNQNPDVKFDVLIENEERGDMPAQDVISVKKNKEMLCFGAINDPTVFVIPQMGD